MSKERGSETRGVWREREEGSKGGTEEGGRKKREGGKEGGKERGREEREKERERERKAKNIKLRDNNLSCLHYFFILNKNSFI